MSARQKEKEKGSKEQDDLVMRLQRSHEMTCTQYTLMCESSPFPFPPYPVYPFALGMHLLAPFLSHESRVPIALLLYCFIALLLGSGEIKYY